MLNDYPQRVPVLIVVASTDYDGFAPNVSLCCPSSCKASNASSILHFEEGAKNYFQGQERTSEVDPYVG